MQGLVTLDRHTSKDGIRNVCGHIDGSKAVEMNMRRTTMKKPDRTQEACDSYLNQVGIQQWMRWKRKDKVKKKKKTRGINPCIRTHANPLLPIGMLWT